MKSRPARAMRQLIRDNRRAAPHRLLASACTKYLRAYYNEGFYDFERNGERFALAQFARWRGDQPTVVWDIGANAGEWALLSRTMLPASTVHSFEILPQIADAFESRMKDRTWSHLHRMGLSDTAGAVEVTWNRECDTTSAINMRSSGVPGGEYQIVSCPVSTVDMEIAKGLPAPDFIKIDTEGHDAAVLHGCADLLASDHAPAMIQFEYGETWLPANETLAATQLMLEEAGYRVGRLFPNHVAFKRYCYADDHFRMGNMIAARPADLVAALAG